MKTKINICIIFLLFIFNCCTYYQGYSQNCFSLNNKKQLKNNLIDLEFINHNSIKFDGIDTIDSYFSGFTETNYPDSLKLIKLKISKRYDMNLFTYEFLPSDYKKYHSEYINFNNQKISIDSLLLLNKYNKIEEENPYLYFKNVYYFHVCDKNFILLSAISRYFYRNGYFVSYLILQIENNKCISASLLYNGYEDENVFGDYNNDGKLDYLSWGVLKDTISLFSLDGNQFKKDTEHYIIVKPTKDQLKYMKQFGENLEYYSVIDRIKTRWFYSL